MANNGGLGPFLCPYCYNQFNYKEDLDYHHCLALNHSLQMESIRKKLIELIQLTYEFPFSPNVGGMMMMGLVPPPNSFHEMLMGLVPPPTPSPPAEVKFHETMDLLSSMDLPIGSITISEENNGARHIPLRPQAHTTSTSGQISTTLSLAPLESSPTTVSDANDPMELNLKLNL